MLAFKCFCPVRRKLHHTLQLNTHNDCRASTKQLIKWTLSTPGSQFDGADSLHCCDNDVFHLLFTLKQLPLKGSVSLTNGSPRLQEHFFTGFPLSALIGN